MRQVAPRPRWSWFTWDAGSLFLTTYDSNPCFHQHGLPVAIMAENGSSIYTPIPDACIDCCFGECHGISCCDCVAGYREHKSISDCHLCHHVMRTAVGVSHFSLRRKPLPGNVPGCTGQFYRSVCTIPDTKETYTDIQIEIFHLFHCPENLFIAAVCLVTASYIKSMFDISFLSFVITSLIACSSTGLIIYLVGITNQERWAINKRIKNRILKIR